MITLSSDFGSPYPAAMKGVLLRGTDARLVDVAHDFPRQDVRAAGFWLREVLPYFPPAVHLVVVDPGVGTDRNAVVVRAGGHAIVAPDNGIALPAARRLRSSDGDGDSIDEDGDPEIFVVDPDAAASRVRHPDDARGKSATFHGRDVFAPAAAAVHETGVGDLETLPFVSPAEEYVDLSLPTAALEDGRACGEVLVVDDFGNAITNVPGDYLGGRERVRVDGEVVPVGETFAAVDPGERLATVGSHGYVELDVNRGRGDRAFDLEPGSEVVLAPA